MKISILGAGKSGVAAAILAKKNNHQVFLSEFSPKSEKNSHFAQKLDKFNIEYEFGGHSEDKILSSDLVISSPGIKPSAPIIQKIKEANIKIIDETDFALDYVDNPIIAISGTNGKTTTTSLIHHIFKSAGRKSKMGGNIGKPLSELALECDKDDILVLELSSFQLERNYRIAPIVSIFLNITPDHLYWHGGIVDYFNSKWKITNNQSEDNLLVLTSNDKLLMQYAFDGGKTTKAQKVGIAIDPDENYFNLFNSGVYSQNGFIYIYEKKGSESIKEEFMPIRELALPGQHNLFNSMAAIIATRRFEVRNEDIRDALSSFTGVEHRLEFVRELQGVEFINDSKATNINAAWYALSAYDRPIIWIAGGLGDNNDYSELDLIVSKSVKTIISYGADGEKIYNHFNQSVKSFKTNTLAEAVEFASDRATKGDLVLFSPACKSFDLYTNFEERGADFKRLVYNL